MEINCGENAQDLKTLCYQVVNNFEREQFLALIETKIEKFTMVVPLSVESSILNDPLTKYFPVELDRRAGDLLYLRDIDWNGDENAEGGWHIVDLNPLYPDLDLESVRKFAALSLEDQLKEALSSTSLTLQAKESLLSSIREHAPSLAEEIQKEVTVTEKGDSQLILADAQPVEYDFFRCSGPKNESVSCAPTTLEAEGLDYLSGSIDELYQSAPEFLFTVADNQLANLEEIQKANAGLRIIVDNSSNDTVDFIQAMPKHQETIAEQFLKLETGTEDNEDSQSRKSGPPAIEWNMNPSTEGDISAAEVLFKASLRNSPSSLLDPISGGHTTATSFTQLASNTLDLGEIDAFPLFVQPIASVGDEGFIGTRFYGLPNRFSELTGYDLDFYDHYLEHKDYFDNAIRSNIFPPLLAIWKVTNAKEEAMLRQMGIGVPGQPIYKKFGDLGSPTDLAGRSFSFEERLSNLSKSFEIKYFVQRNERLPEEINIESDPALTQMQNPAPSPSPIASNIPLLEEEVTVTEKGNSQPTPNPVATDAPPVAPEPAEALPPAQIPALIVDRVNHQYPQDSFRYAGLMPDGNYFFVMSRPGAEPNNEQRENWRAVIVGAEGIRETTIHSVAADQIGFEDNTSGEQNNQFTLYLPTSEHPQMAVGNESVRSVSEEDIRQWNYRAWVRRLSDFAQSLIAVQPNLGEVVPGEEALAGLQQTIQIPRQIVDAVKTFLGREYPDTSYVFYAAGDLRDEDGTKIFILSEPGARPRDEQKNRWKVILVEPTSVRVAAIDTIVLGGEGNAQRVTIRFNSGEQNHQLVLLHSGAMKLIQNSGDQLDVPHVHLEEVQNWNGWSTERASVGRGEEYRLSKNIINESSARQNPNPAAIRQNPVIIQLNAEGKMMVNDQEIDIADIHHLKVSVGPLSLHGVLQGWAAVIDLENEDGETVAVVQLMSNGSWQLIEDFSSPEEAGAASGRDPMALRQPREDALPPHDPLPLDEDLLQRIQVWIREYTAAKEAILDQGPEDSEEDRRENFQRLNALSRSAVDLLNEIDAFRDPEINPINPLTSDVPPLSSIENLPRIRPGIIGSLIAFRDKGMEMDGLLDDLGELEFRLAAYRPSAENGYSDYASQLAVLHGNAAALLHILENLVNQAAVTSDEGERARLTERIQKLETDFNAVQAELQDYQEAFETYLTNWQFHINHVAMMGLVIVEQKIAELNAAYASYLETNGADLLSGVPLLSENNQTAINRLREAGIQLTAMRDSVPSPSDESVIALEVPQVLRDRVRSTGGSIVVRTATFGPITRMGTPLTLQFFILREGNEGTGSGEVIGQFLRRAPIDAFSSGAEEAAAEQTLVPEVPSLFTNYFKSQYGFEGEPEISVKGNEVDLKFGDSGSVSLAYTGEKFQIKEIKNADGVHDFIYSKDEAADALSKRLAKEAIATIEGLDPNGDYIVVIKSPDGDLEKILGPDRVSVDWGSKQMTDDQTFDSAMDLLAQENIATAIPIDSKEVTLARVMELRELSKESALMITASGEVIAVTSGDEEDIRIALNQEDMHQLIKSAKFIVHTHPDEKGASDVDLAAAEKDQQYLITKSGTVWRFGGGQASEIISESEFAAALNAALSGDAPSEEEIAATHDLLNKFIASQNDFSAELEKANVREFLAGGPSSLGFSFNVFQNNGGVPAGEGRHNPLNEGEGRFGFGGVSRPVSNPPVSNPAPVAPMPNPMLPPDVLPPQNPPAVNPNVPVPVENNPVQPNPPAQPNVPALDPAAPQPQAPRPNQNPPRLVQVDEVMTNLDSNFRPIAGTTYELENINSDGSGTRLTNLTPDFQPTSDTISEPITNGLLAQRGYAIMKAFDTPANSTESHRPDGAIEVTSGSDAWTTYTLMWPLPDGTVRIATNLNSDFTHRPGMSEYLTQQVLNDGSVQIAVLLAPDFSATPNTVYFRQKEGPDGKFYLAMNLASDFSGIPGTSEYLIQQQLADGSIQLATGLAPDFSDIPGTSEYFIQKDLRNGWVQVASRLASDFSDIPGVSKYVRQKYDFDGKVYVVSNLSSNFSEIPGTTDYQWQRMMPDGSTQLATNLDHDFAPTAATIYSLRRPRQQPAQNRNASEQLNSDPVAPALAQLDVPQVNAPVQPVLQNVPVFEAPALPINGRAENAIVRPAILNGGVQGVQAVAGNNGIVNPAPAPAENPAANVPGPAQSQLANALISAIDPRERVRLLNQADPSMISEMIRRGEMTMWDIQQILNDRALALGLDPAILQMLEQELTLLQAREQDQRQDGSMLAAFELGMGNLPEAIRPDISQRRPDETELEFIRRQTEARGDRFIAGVSHELPDGQGRVTQELGPSQGNDGNGG